MDWIDVIMVVWVACGVLGFIVGIAWDTKHNRVHSIFSYCVFLLVCLMLGIVALMITCDIWYDDYRRDKWRKRNG